MKGISLGIIILAIGFIACKEKEVIKDPQNVQGKYVNEIDHYTIKFQDGTTFDLDEKTTRKVYYLVRHAEKDSIPKDDPNLSSIGLERAKRLAAIFKNTQLDALYSTLTTRTLFTVDTLADIKGLVTFPYEVKNFKEVADKLDASLDYHRVLIVGHSNSTPVLANYLYADEYFKQTFKEDDYDNLVVVIEDYNKNKKLLDLKYK
jgi:broad specificity phosphatase PhoE